MSLELKNLRKAFGDKLLFEDLSYEFPDSGIFAIVGESGVGKTTLLRMISGLEANYSGEILGGGITNVSLAFQEYRLFPGLTALENAYLANNSSVPEALKKKSSDLLTDFGFSDDELNLKPDELSGGMKQRVSLVRAFLKDSPILILDEPTKELDSDLRDKLYSYIAEVSKTRLVLMVSHHVEDLEKLNAVKINI